MANVTLRGPSALEPLAHQWRRISPRLVPLFALITALIISTIFMMVIHFSATGNIDIGEQINKAGTAYSALLEGSVGLVINRVLVTDDLNLAKIYLQGTEITPREANQVARTAADVATTGMTSALRYADVFAQHPTLTDDQMDTLGADIPDIQLVGDETLLSMRPLIAGLSKLDTTEANDLLEQAAGLEAMTPEFRTTIEQAIPAATDYSDDDLLAYMKAIQSLGRNKSIRLADELDLMSEQELSSTSLAAQDIAAIAQIGTAKVRNVAAFAQQLDALGIHDPQALADQLRIIKDLYDDGLLTGENVDDGLENQLAPMLDNTVVVLRPNNQILYKTTSNPWGIILAENKTPDDPSDDNRPEAVFLNLGSRALLFFPVNVEGMLTRAIPFIIAGLAVGFAFKGGLFNIGVTGQLYIGGVLSAWIGFSPIFADMASLPHILLLIVMGIVGGFLWGAIPGLLKAFTGAHEVINTIMLNFIGILLVDWLVKSTDPVILRDVSATVPRTPYIVESAHLPTFNEISAIWFFVAGLVVLLWGLWSRREHIRQNVRLAIRPIVNGILVILAGLFLGWVSVTGTLHIGLLIMLFAVWFTGWFLDRTTLGFELRTVGTNADAAKYAGMNVALNIFLAMAISGALAGLAGSIEVSGVQFNMQPGFFGNIGFDAIAVALLARINPRSMIPAGLLWGGLLAGAGLMQTRAEISIDLVRIIQALIIMFVAADAIIRYLWRVPEASEEEKAAVFAAKGWAG